MRGIWFSRYQARSASAAGPDTVTQFPPQGSFTWLARPNWGLDTVMGCSPCFAAYSLASRSRATVQLDPPKARIRPASFISWKVSIISPTGVSGSSRCSRQMSIISVRSVSRDRARSRFISRALTRRVPSSAGWPHLVSSTTFSRFPGFSSQRPREFSDRP